MIYENNCKNNTRIKLSDVYYMALFFVCTFTSISLPSVAALKPLALIKEDKFKCGDAQ